MTTPNFAASSAGPSATGPRPPLRPRPAPITPPPAPARPLIVGDVSFVLIGMTGVLAVTLAIICAVLLGALAGTEVNLVWFTTRGSGIAAYILVVGVMVYGLLLSARSNPSELPSPVSYGMHDYLTWLSLGFTALHMFILLLDKYIPYTLGSVLLPFASPYEPVFVGAGQISLYLSLIVTLSLYARKWIGQRAWRLIHYLSYGAFALVTLHGLLSGTDSKSIVMLAVYAVSAIGVTGLTAYRVLASAALRSRRVA